MTHASYARWFVGASLLASAAGSIGCASAPAPEPTLECRAVAVYFDAAEISETDLLQSLSAEYGAIAVKQRFDRRLITGTHRRLSALVLELEQGRRRLSLSEWKAIKQAIETLHGVTGAERHEAQTLRGAPIDMPWPTASMTSTDVMAQPALAQMNVAGATGTGSGVKVAVLDGGFDLDHPMVDDLFLGGYDAIDDDTDAQDLGNGVDDDQDGLVDELVGHGTFATGLIHSVAPAAEIIPIRVLDDEGHGTNLALWLGITAALDADADVINLSLVASSMPSELQDAIDAACAAGVAIVTAAGNAPAGPSVHSYLGDRASVVGAVDASNVVLNWSPTASGVTVYAPGLDLKGPIGGSGAKAGSYGYWDGTSFSAAFVSGVVALVKETSPSLTAAQVRSRVRLSYATAAGCASTALGRIDAEVATE